MTAYAPEFVPALLIILSVCLPLLLASALLMPAWRSAVIRVSPLASLPGLLCSLAVPNGSMIDVPWLLLKSRFGLDEAASALLFSTALIWWVAGVSARQTARRDSLDTQFFAFFLLAMSGNFGLVLAQDALSFYLFFALMSLATYGLIVHRRDEGALWAGRVYICLVVFGEVALFAAMVMLPGTVDSPDLVLDGKTSDLAIALVLVAFGVKAGLLPVHVSLPLIYRAGPTSAGIALAGAMLNAGLLGWLRFLPLGQEQLMGWGEICLLAGLFAAFYGVAVGLTQRNPRVLLAYSSISQMGLMIIIISAGFISPDTWPLAQAAVLVYAAHHSLAKGALFYGIGLSEQGTTAGHRLWKFGLLLPALSLGGLPLTSGAVAKMALKSTVHTFPPGLQIWLEFLLPLAAVATTLLMIRYLSLVWSHDRQPEQKSSIPWSWIVMLLTMTLFIWFWPLADGSASASLEPGMLWNALWPVVLAASMWRALHGFGWNRVMEVPAGDLLVPVVRIWHRLLDLVPKFRAPDYTTAPRTLRRGLRRLDPLWDKLEQGMADWIFVGISYLALVLVLFILFM